MGTLIRSVGFSSSLVIPEPHGWDEASIGISGSSVEISVKGVRLCGTGALAGNSRTIGWYGTGSYDSEIYLLTPGAALVAQCRRRQSTYWSHNSHGLIERVQVRPDMMYRMQRAKWPYW